MNRYFKYGLSSIVTVFFLGITAAVLANGLYTPPAHTGQPYFNGPYVGVGMGVVSAEANVASSSFSTFTLPSAVQKYNFNYKYSINYQFDKAKHGFNGNMFVGYGRTFESSSSYYLGGELFGHYFSPKLRGSRTHVIQLFYSYIADNGTEVKNPCSFGGDMRAGYLVKSKTMLYVLFGLDYTQFKVNNELTETQLLFPSVSVNFNNNFTKWKLGYFPGVGIETGLSDHISLRAQYVFTFYPSFSHTSVASGKEPVLYKGNLTTKIKPKRQLFTVKLSYLFGNY